MICVACGEGLSEPLESCPHCHQDPWLSGGWQLVSVLGSRQSQTTYKGRSREDAEAGRDQWVVIKELLLQRMESFKVEELFERECAVLKQLSHPSIPSFVDAFQAGQGRHIGFYLVQEWIEGQDLSKEQESRRYDEAQVLEILDECAGILEYLHRLTPPVIHRDIKPSNLLRRASGGLVLVDFGSVKEALEGADGRGSTVAGTFGFMAPEQFVGEASPATDLFGLGATAVQLLTRQDPARLLDRPDPLSGLASLSLSPGFSRLLRDLLAKRPEARPASAARVRERIQQIREDPHQTADEAPDPQPVSKALAHVTFPPPSTPIPRDREIPLGLEAFRGMVNWKMIRTRGALFSVPAILVGALTHSLFWTGVALLPLGLLGYATFVTIYRAPERWRQLYRSGEFTPGRIDAITAHEQTPQSQDMLRLEYSFAWGGEEYSEWILCLAGGTVARLSEGDAVWVVVDPENPKAQNMIYEMLLWRAEDLQRERGLLAP